MMYIKLDENNKAQSLTVADLKAILNNFNDDNEVLIFSVQKQELMNVRIVRSTPCGDIVIME